MASKKAIQAHIEEIEKLKEMARLRIEKIIRSTPPDRLIRENPYRTAQRLTREAQSGLLGEIGDAITEAQKWGKATGMAPLTPQESRAIAKEIVREWSAAFETKTRRNLIDLQRQIMKETKRGLSGDALKRSLNRDAMKERIYKEVSRAKTMGGSLTNEIGKRVRDEGLAKTPGLFTWITTEDSNVCDDSFDTSCDPRHGETMKASEWREVGLPGSVVLLCSSFGRIQCRCELVHADSREADLYEKVNVAESIRRGKERAQDEV